MSERVGSALPSYSPFEVVTCELATRSRQSEVPESLAQFYSQPVVAWANVAADLQAVGGRGAEGNE